MQTLGSQTFNNCSYTFSLNDFYSLNSHLYFLDLTVSKKKKKKKKKFHKNCCTCFNSSLSMNVARFFLSRIFSDFFCRFTFAMMNKKKRMQRIYKNPQNLVLLSFSKFLRFGVFCKNF